MIFDTDGAGFIEIPDELCEDEPPGTVTDDEGRVWFRETLDGQYVYRRSVT